MTEFKLVPTEPTEAMIEAARDQHEGEPYLPVSLYKAMLAAAPDVQGEPVGEVRIELGTPSVVYGELYSEAAPHLVPGTLLYAAPQPVEKATAPKPIKTSYTDGVGACRRSPEDCRYGISYVTVADTVYWPLSADDAQRLRSAECGGGDFTGPANECPDVSGLVEALTELCDEIDKHEIHAAISKTSISWFKRKARKALAAHRKQGGE